MPASAPGGDVPHANDVYVADEAAEAKAAFHLRMRARGIRDLAVLRAFELVPRQTFVPHRYRDLAMRDLALPIGCGQTLDEPWLLARMIEALDVRPAHRVLQIGAGTGYATAILAQLAETVVGYERYRSLATAAQARLSALGVANASVEWGDGLAVSTEAGTFDRILVHGLLGDFPAALFDRLVENGIMIAARPAGDAQALTRSCHAGEGFVDTPICPCRMQPILGGLAAAL